MKITRPNFCTTVGIDEYDYKGQFDDAFKGANQLYEKGISLPNEEIHPPYFPLDMGKVYGLLSEIDKQAAEIARLREALKEIQKGEGAYSTDQLEHAGNTIENMKNIAREALKAGE